jgi:hypothetical protein
MPIVWTKEARAEVSPRRGQIKTPPPATTPDDLAAQVRAALDDRASTYAAGVEAKLGEHALVSEVLALYKHFDADSPLDPRVQGAMCAMLEHWGDRTKGVIRALVLHWIARGGLAFAVRAIHEYGKRGTTYPQKKSGGYGNDMAIAKLDVIGDWSLFHRNDAAREELAPRILAASDAEYRAVVAVVAEARADAGSSMRCDLSSVVPTETAWAREDTRALLGVKKDRELRSATRLFHALGRCDEARDLLAAIAPVPHLVGDAAYDAVDALEDDAIEPLAKALAGWEEDTPKANGGLAEARRAMRALALFDDARVATAFAPWVGDAKSFGPIAAEYMQRFPARAVVALAPRLLEKTKGAEPSHQLLARVARAHGEDVRAAARDLPDDVRTAVEKVVGASAREASAPAANAADVPAVLRDPPWHRKGARPTLPIVETLREVAYDERVVWEDEETRKEVATPRWAGTVGRLGNVEYIRRTLEMTLSKGKHDVPSFARTHIAWHAIHDKADALSLWNETPLWARHISESSIYSEVACMLARHGVEAIAGGVESAQASSAVLAFRALARCDSPRVAPAMLRALGRGALRNIAIEWTHAHAEAAAIGFLRVALGALTRTKVDAANALRVHVDRAVATAAAAKLGDDASRALEALFVFDPLFDCPKTPPKLSAFADPATLPALRLANGALLDDDAKKHFLEMLQFTPLEPCYAGIAPAVVALDRTSVDDLLRVLLDAWVGAGASSASAWALRAIAHAGSPAMARELAAKIRKWPREKGRPRALIGVDVLGAMGNDVALMHLFDLSKTAKNRHVEARATAVLANAASARALDGDELEDRLVPTLDLAPDGTTMLDFGARTFTVRVDEHLAPRVHDASGALVPSLPRANKDDVADKAKAASARFKTLKSDLETLAKTLLHRFEHAMIAQRRWDASEHRALLVDHPLAGRVARKLVWAVYANSELTSMFRVAEDGTFADDQDKALVLDDDARVGLPHPLGLTDAQKALWSRILADYAVIQPFEQLGRATFAVDAKKRDQIEIDDFAKREIPYGVVFGRLESRGWRRGAMDEGSVSTLEKNFGSAFAVLDFSPALYVREKPPSDVTIDSIAFGGAKLRDVPAIAFSEAMFDLHVFQPRR